MQKLILKPSLNLCEYVKKGFEIIWHKCTPGQGCVSQANWASYFEGQGHTETMYRLPAYNCVEWREIP